MKKMKMTWLVGLGIIAFGFLGMVMPVQADDIYSGATVSGNVIVDGDLQDWTNIPGVELNGEKAQGWKVALSADKSVLYLCMYGTASNEWDYNFQWEVVSFGDTMKFQLASLVNSIEGAQVVIVNNANGSVEGDYVVECALPVDKLPLSNYMIGLANANLWAKDIPVLDGIDTPEAAVANPVYAGIVIDGVFTDWAAVSKTPAGCPNNEHPDCITAAAMVFDGDYVYIYLESGNSSNAFWSGTHSNGKFEITTDLGHTLRFSINSNDTISGVDGALCRHYGNKVEIAIPKSALPTYTQSLSLGFAAQSPFISGVVNLQPEQPAGQFSGIVYDGLYGDWTYYPHQILDYAGAGSHHKETDGEGALYYDAGTNYLYGHVKTVKRERFAEQASLFTSGVTFKFGEAEGYTFSPRFIQVGGNGDINWNPHINGMANGTYEYYIVSLDAWGTSKRIGDMHGADKIYGKMKVTISDSRVECEFYLDLKAVAEKFGCNPQEFKVLKAQFGRLGNQWLVTAGASSGAAAGVALSIVAVGSVLGIRKKKKGIAG